MRKIMIGLLVGLFAVVGLGVAYGAVTTGPSTTGQQADGGIFACVNQKTKAYTARTTSRCPAGTVQLAWYGTVSASRTKTAVTKLSNRADSGVKGNTWATDTILRTAGVQRVAQVPASNCGATVARCFFYTGTITDDGTFVTKAGDSPQGTATIPAGLEGTLHGTAGIEFYSAAPSQKTGAVPAPTQVGNDIATSDWFKQFFPDGTDFSSANLTGWSWTYTTTSGPTSWTNAIAGNLGDITA